MITALVATLAVARAQGLTGTWKYQAFDPKSHLVAEGRLTFQPDPKHGSNFYWGTKAIHQVRSFETAGPHETIGGKGTPQTALGQLNGDQVSIDLNAGYADNNILLKGKLTGNSIKGTWGHSTIAGIRERGTFTLIRTK
jgi:hypothetical protein